MRMLLLVLFALVVLAVSALAAEGPIRFPGTTPRPYAPVGLNPAIAADFVWSTNLVRSEHGLPALVPDPGLVAESQLWSGGMALFDTLVEGRRLGVAIAAVDPGWNLAGENVGVGFTPQSIEAALIASPPHLANILGRFTHIGVGVFVDGAGRIWVTERFYG